MTMYAITRAFKSANTVRITIPRYARRALNLLAGDSIKLDDLEPGKCTLTVLDPTGNPRCLPKRIAQRSRKYRSRK